MKAQCQKCDNMAVWWYMPDGDRYYCDTCVPRGCSCNIYPIYMSEMSQEEFNIWLKTSFATIDLARKYLKEVYKANSEHIADEELIEIISAVKDDFANKLFNYDAEAYYMERDVDGRDFPCVEFGYDKEGVEDERFTITE